MLKSPRKLSLNALDFYDCLPKANTHENQISIEIKVGNKLFKVEKVKNSEAGVCQSLGLFKNNDDGGDGGGVVGAKQTIKTSCSANTE